MRHCVQRIYNCLDEQADQELVSKYPYSSSEADTQNPYNVF